MESLNSAASSRQMNAAEPRSHARSANAANVRQPVHETLNVKHLEKILQMKMLYSFKPQSERTMTSFLYTRVMGAIDDQRARGGESK